MTNDSGEPVHINEKVAAGRFSLKRWFYRASVYILQVVIFFCVAFKVLADQWGKPDECLPVVSVPSSKGQGQGRMFWEDVLLLNAGNKECYVVGSLWLDPPPGPIPKIDFSPRKIEQYCYYDSATGLFRLAMNAVPGGKLEPVQPGELVRISFSSRHHFTILDTNNLHTSFQHYSVKNAIKGISSDDQKHLDYSNFTLPRVLLSIAVIAALMLVIILPRSLRMLELLNDAQDGGSVIGGVL